MAVCQGSLGRITAFADFTGIYDSVAWGATNLVSGDTWGTGWGFASVNEGSFASTVDEANGVLAITTDTGDNDNCVLIGPRMQPSINAPLVIEARFKFNSATLGAVYCGFTETLSLTTPVMPAEFATATMTYNGSGQMLGAQLDTDATTNDFRALGGDAGAVYSGWDTNGTRANETITADEWYIVRCELETGGTGRVLVGHKNKSLDLIKEVDDNPTTNLLYPILMFENRSGAARVFEVDYCFASGARDWEVT